MWNCKSHKWKWMVWVQRTDCCWLA